MITLQIIVPFQLSQFQETKSTMCSCSFPNLGSKISVITKSDIRYEGILYTNDLQMSTVALSEVRSLGSEDRRKDRPVAPSDEVYEFVIFRRAEIKHIIVLEQAKPKSLQQGDLLDDPAICNLSTFQTLTKQQR